MALAEQQGQNVERKMLYFSETAWTLPNMMVISQDFDRNYNQDEYEAKVGKVIRHVRDCAPGKHGDDGWNEAINHLRGEDHYLLVLIDGGYKVAGKGHSGDIFRLIAASVLVSVVTLGSAFFDPTCH